MKSLFELEQKRSKAMKSYRAKQKRLESQKDAIDARLKNMRYPSMKNYLNRLGKAALPLIKGAVSFEIYGPFGMCNEWSIYFRSNKKDPKSPGDFKTLAGASFARTDEGYGLRDYSKNTGRFAKGSIGELNGMNYPTIEITEKMTLDWFVKFAKKGYNR